MRARDHMSCASTACGRCHRGGSGLLVVMGPRCSQVDGGPVSPSVPHSIHAWWKRGCWALATGRQAGCFSQGGVCTCQSLGPGRGLSIRGVSGDSLPLGCPGSGFRVGLTSPLSVACPALALPVRGAAPGPWVRLTDQASHARADWALTEAQGEGSCGEAMKSPAAPRTPVPPSL